jgi:HK97 family phage major capsid protein
LSVSYRVVSGEAGTVGEQLTEGAALGYMELAFEEKTAPVKTYGGYISLSRQVIDQADSAYLSKEVEYMVNQYAKATNDAVRAALVAGTGYNTGNLGTGTETAKMWIDVVTDSADLIEANARGPKAEFVLVSADVYKRLAHLVDTTGRPIFAHNGDGSNTLGAANIVAGTLNIAGLRVVKDAALAANSAFVAASDAVTTWETPGAPFRLEDENIINLTKDFSLYGYMAVGITNPLAVVKLDVDLV